MNLSYLEARIDRRIDRDEVAVAAKPIDEGAKIGKMGAGVTNMGSGVISHVVIRQ
jgi:hypothetical protein